MELLLRVPVAVVVLTHNEERNLPRCLESVVEWAGETFVVDSGSTDNTVEIARRYNANVAHHPFRTHAMQWKWALDNLPYHYEWVLGLDADQRLSPELREELARLFSTRAELVKGIDGFYVKRRQVFRGRWIRHGGYYPKYLLKLFRPEKVRLDDGDRMDHHFYVDGRTGKLTGDLIEDNQKENDIGFWIEKHNSYAELLAEEELRRRHNGAGWPILPSLFGTPDQRTLWLKRLWYHLPLYVRPFLYFSYRYFLRIGFLDGKQGFLFHFLQGFWFRLLVDIKIDELRREQKSEVGVQTAKGKEQRAGSE